MYCKVRKKGLHNVDLCRICTSSTYRNCTSFSSIPSLPPFLPHRAQRDTESAAGGKDDASLRPWVVLVAPIQHREAVFLVH
jgi:hypothetical protein